MSPRDRDETHIVADTNPGVSARGTIETEGMGDIPIEPSSR